MIWSHMILIKHIRKRSLSSDWQRTGGSLQLAIAFITAELANKASFAYSYMQTRLMVKQWKMTHYPYLCVKTADICDNSYSMRKEVCIQSLMIQ